MTAWILIALESLVWLAILYLVGSLFLFICNVRSLRLFAFAPLFSIALLGSLTLITTWIPWSSPSIAVFEILTVLVIALVVRWALQRQRFACSLKYQAMLLRDQVCTINRVRLAVSTLGIAISFACALYLLSGISLESPIGIQNYDNPFHFSVVRLILETGIASPIGAGSVMGESTAVYPSLWHALVALNSELFSSEIAMSAWVICLLFIGFVAPIGMVILTKTILKQPNYFSVFLAAVLPVITCKALTYFMVFGTLFANLAGLCLVPLALALIVFLQQHNAVEESGSTISDSSQDIVCDITAEAKNKQPLNKVIALTLGCIVSVLALGLAHPSTVFILFIFLIPFAITKCMKLWGKALILLGAATCWLALMQSSLFFRTINCTDRIPDDIQLGQTYLSALHLDYSALASLDYLPVLLFVFCLIIGTAIAWLLRKRFANGWYFVGLAFIAGQILCSLFPENWFSIIATGFWYRDCPRLVVIFLFMATCLIAYFPTLCETLAKKIAVIRKHRIIQIAISAIICIACLITLSHGNDYRDELRTMSTVDALTPDEIAFMEHVAQITDGAIVLNNADDNSVWLYPIYDVKALIKGRPANQMSSMPEDVCMIIEGIDQIGRDSNYGKQVRTAAESLNVQYVVKMSNLPTPTLRLNNLGQVTYEPCDAITRVNERTPGLTLVYEANGMQLFEVNESR